MNIDYSELPFAVAAKMCGCRAKKRKVTYLLLDPYHSLCMDKKDIISAQLETCERLLKYIKDDIDKKTIEEELVELKMALNLMP
jgi:hypothetical protein